MVTTIQLDENTKRILDKLKIHHRETYNELLKRIALIYSKKEKESFEETIEILSDPQTMRDIAQGLEDYEKGKGTKLKDFEKELNLDA